MRISKVRPDKWHRWSEGDVGSPIYRHGKHLYYYKKGFWKRRDRKKYLKTIIKQNETEQTTY